MTRLHSLQFNTSLNSVLSKTTGAIKDQYLQQDKLAFSHAYTNDRSATLSGHIYIEISCYDLWGKEGLRTSRYVLMNAPWGFDVGGKV